jgi:hypothetical protein
MLCLTVLAFGPWWARIRIAVFASLLFAIPVLSTSLTIDSTGFSWQGRYLLPLAVGLPILAAFEIGRLDLLDRRRNRDLVGLFVLLLAPIQLFSLVVMLNRYGNAAGSGGGAETVNPFAYLAWRPPLGSGVPILLMTLGLALLVRHILRTARPATPGSPDLPGVDPTLTVPAQRSPAEPAGTSGRHPSGTSHSERPRLQPSATDRVP